MVASSAESEGSATTVGAIGSQEVNVAVTQHGKTERHGHSVTTTKGLVRCSHLPAASVDISVRLRRSTVAFSAP